MEVYIKTDKNRKRNIAITTSLYWLLYFDNKVLVNMYMKDIVSTACSSLYKSYSEEDIELACFALVNDRIDKYRKIVQNSGLLLDNEYKRERYTDIAKDCVLLMCAITVVILPFYMRKEVLTSFVDNNLMCIGYGIAILNCLLAPYFIVSGLANISILNTVEKMLENGYGITLEDVDVKCIEISYSKAGISIP